MDHVDVPGRGRFPLLKTNLWEDWGTEKVWKVGYCCDVMEHIPPEHVEAVLMRIFAHCDRVFFGISFNPDHFGPALVGEPLHLTVRPYVWWRDLLADMAVLKESRDLLGEGVFHCVSW